MRPPPEDLADVEAVNARFRREAARFGLRYRCNDCVHVDPPSGACSLGYPNTRLMTGPVQAIDAGGELVFCKYFELY